MKRPLPKVCHCGSGKFPGTMREHGWCCGVCHNDFKRCPGPAKPNDHGASRLDLLIGCLIAFLIVLAVTLGGSVAP